MGQASNAKVSASFGWKLAERFGAQISNFIVTLVLARLLMPEDYGVVSLILVFVNLATVFVQGGFNTALIQKKELEKRDYSSILYFSLTMAGALYALIFFCAPLLADFYEMPELNPMLRVTALILFPGAINSVLLARATRNFEFHKLTISSLLAIALSASVGIWMAAKGYGSWALVGQQLTLHTTTFILQCLILRWVPIGGFSFKSVKTMAPFGFKVFAVNFMNALFLDIRSLMISKQYDTATLGNFTKGQQFPMAILESINSAIQSVLLPLYSKEQDNRSTVVSMLRITIKIAMFIIVPLAFGLFIVAENMITVLLTEKWLGCVFFLQIYSLRYMMGTFIQSPLQVYRALGDSTTPLVLEIMKKVFEIVLLIITITISVEAVAWSVLAAGIFAVVLTMIFSRIKLGYTIGQQIADMLPSILLGIFMLVGVWLVDFLPLSPLVSLVLQVLAGGVLYVGGAFLFRLEPLKMLLQLIKSHGKKKAQTPPPNN